MNNRENREKAFKMAEKLNTGSLLDLNQEELAEYSAMMIKFAQTGVRRLFNCVLNPFFPDQFSVCCDLEEGRGCALGRIKPYKNKIKEQDKRKNIEDRKGFLILPSSNECFEIQFLFDGIVQKTIVTTLK